MGKTRKDNLEIKNKKRTLDYSPRRINSQQLMEEYEDWLEDELDEDSLDEDVDNTLTGWNSNNYQLKENEDETSNDRPRKN